MWVPAHLCITINPLERGIPGNACQSTGGRWVKAVLHIIISAWNVISHLKKPRTLSTRNGGLAQYPALKEARIRLGKQPDFGYRFALPYTEWTYSL